MMIKKLIRYCCIVIGITAVSCASVPQESDIPEDATPADLTQKAQEAFDANNYKAAHAYYQIILKRFASDPVACIAAEYEIAHLLIKERKWQKAYDALERIIAQYEGLGSMHLPPQYLKLAKIDYSRAKEKIRPKQNTQQSMQQQRQNAQKQNVQTTQQDTQVQDAQTTQQDMQEQDVQTTQQNTQEQLSNNGDNL